MNEPQVWTLIGIFASALFGIMTIMSTLFVRIVRSEIAGLRIEMKGELEGLRGDIRGLDRDISALMKHTFGIDRG